MSENCSYSDGFGTLVYTTIQPIVSDECGSQILSAAVKRQQEAKKSLDIKVRTVLDKIMPKLRDMIEEAIREAGNE